MISVTKAAESIVFRRKHSSNSNQEHNAMDQNEKSKQSK